MYEKRFYLSFPAIQADESLFVAFFKETEVDLFHICTRFRMPCSGKGTVGSTLLQALYIK